MVGLVGPALAALPAIRRASRLPLHEALQASGSAVGGQGRLDGLLRRARFLPRSAQIGLRGVARRLRRTIATVAQIALAVATLLALLSLGSGVATTTRGWFDDNHFDVWVQTVASEPFDAEAQRLIASTEGVREAQGWTQNTVRVDGQDAAAWGLPARPLMNTHMVRGRWYSDAEAADGSRVAVLGRTLAKATGKDVGDRITVSTECRPRDVPRDRHLRQPGRQRRRGLRAARHAAAGARLSRRGQQLLDHHERPPTTRGSTARRRGSRTRSRRTATRW